MNTQINLNQPRIQPSSSTGCKASSLTSQFACPTGLLGGGVGRLMAVKNAKMNEFAVEMLDIQLDRWRLNLCLRARHPAGRTTARRITHRDWDVRSTEFRSSATAGQHEARSG